MNTRFEIKELEIEGVKLITPLYLEDERGYFMKSIERGIFREWGLDADIFEEFETYSKKGVIRGMHFQTREPQVKIIQVIRGTVHDVIIDLRKGSKSFGQKLDIDLSDKEPKILWVPKGFAHGFEVLSEEAIMSYKCVGRYLRDYDTGIRWNDSRLKIAWKTQNPIVSEKDQGLMSFTEFCNAHIGLDG